MKNEQTSKSVASKSGALLRKLRGAYFLTAISADYKYVCTIWADDIKAALASALTQAPDKKRKRARNAK